MRDVLGADIDGFFVFEEIELPVGQAEPPLKSEHHVVLGIFEIGGLRKLERQIDANLIGLGKIHGKLLVIL